MWLFREGKVGVEGLVSPLCMRLDPRVVWLQFLILSKFVLWHAVKGCGSCCWRDGLGFCVVDGGVSIAGVF